MTVNRWRWIKVTLAALAALTFGTIAGCGGDEEGANGGDAAPADNGGDGGASAPVFPSAYNA